MLPAQLSGPVPAAELGAAKWRKSRHSNPSGNCVEMASLPGEQVAVRDSHRPDGPALLFTRAAWDRFVHGLREAPVILAAAGPEPATGGLGHRAGPPEDLQRIADARR